MLVAEDLLLLLLDDESGSLAASSQVQVALGGAVLAELALTESVVVGEKTGMWRTAKVVPAGTPPADPVLAEAWAEVAEKERSAQDLVSRLGKGLKDRLLARLVESGIVREEKDRVLGLFPRTRWPAVSSTHEAEVRRALEDTLLRGQDPDPRTGSLVALLSALDQAHRVVDHPGMSGGEVKKRAKAVAEGEWAARGVSDAIAATNAAVMTAIIASTTVATTSGS
jgi:hypothetical protein